MTVREDRTFEKVIAVAIILVLGLLAFGFMTRKDPEERPAIGIAGGGVVFNYREGDVFYGFTAHVLKPLPAGSVLLSTFEDPGGGPPLTVETRLHARSTRYKVQSPSVRGVRAGRPYHVGIRLYDRTRSRLLWSGEKTYSSQIDDTIVPEKPLTIGPGYFPNPDLRSAGDLFQR
jgi:hypothetical protein